jgi:hypothetical protein
MSKERVVSYMKVIQCCWLLLDSIAHSSETFCVLLVCVNLRYLKASASAITTRTKAVQMYIKEKALLHKKQCLCLEEEWQSHQHIIPPSTACTEPVV